jgi:predicted N-formylglutamate amidohydrolase
MRVDRPRKADRSFLNCSRDKRVLSLRVGDYEPYSVSDATDYTIPAHGQRRNLLHVEIEVRQDLIADDSGQRMWGARLARLLPQAYRELASTGSLGFE